MRVTSVDDILRRGKRDFLGFVFSLIVCALLLGWAGAHLKAQSSIRLVQETRLATIGNAFKYIWETEGSRQGRAYLEEMEKNNPLISQLDYLNSDALKDSKIEGLSEAALQKGLRQALESPKRITRFGRVFTFFKIGGGVLVCRFHHPSYSQAFLTLTLVWEILLVLLGGLLVLIFLRLGIHTLKPLYSLLLEYLPSTSISGKISKLDPHPRLFHFYRQFGKVLEQALTQLTKTFSVVDQLPVGLITANAFGKVTYANQKFCALVGADSLEIQGTRWKEFILPEDKEQAIQIWEQAVKEEISLEHQWRFCTRDGLINWVRTYTHPIRAMTNQVVGLMGVCIPINHHQNHQDLGAIKSEGLFRALGHAHVGAWEWNLLTNGYLESSIILQVLGYPPTKIEKTIDGWCQLIHPDDRASFKKIIQQAALERRSFQTQYRIQSSLGEWVWLYSRGGIADKDQSGACTRIMGIHFLLSDEFELTEFSKADESKIPLQMSFTLDLQGKVLSWSPEAEAVYNISEEKAIGTSFYDVLSAKWRSAFKDVVEKIAQGSKQATLNCYHTYHDGRIIPMTFEIRAAKDSTNALTGVIVVGNNRQKDELLRFQQHSILQQKSSLIAIISRQLRTPISVIENSLEILEELMGSNEEAKEFAEICKRSTQQIIELVRDTLVYESLEIGKKVWRNEKIHFVQLVQELFGNWKSRFEEQGLALELKVPNEIPEVSGDDEAIRRSVDALISNALKFTKEGGATIKVECDDGRIVIEVTDTGIGIKEEDFPLLFTLFTQIASSNLRFGSGLGLVLAKKIVEHYNGEITYTSKFGQGSTFRLIYPEEGFKDVSESNHRG